MLRPEDVNTSSKYMGVCLHGKGRWQTQISSRILKKGYVGSFDCEYQAGAAYGKLSIQDYSSCYKFASVLS